MPKRLRRGEAESIGKFDAANGYVGGIAVVGNIPDFIQYAGGTVQDAESLLLSIGQNYVKGYPKGFFAWSFSNEKASASAGTDAGEIQRFLTNQIGSLAPFFDAETGYASVTAPWAGPEVLYRNYIVRGMRRNIPNASFPVSSE